MKYQRDSQVVLIIDPSSDCIGWTIAHLQNGVFTITNSGALTSSSSWELGRKLLYMYNGIKFLAQYYNVNCIVSEEAFVGRGKTGSTVVPTIVNNLKMLVYDLKGVFDLETITVDTWRKLLSITGVPLLNANGQLVLNKRGKPKKDFKVPCAIKVKEILKVDIPELILDNRSLKLKKLSDDVTDSLGIAIAFGMSLHYPQIRAEPDLFTGPSTIHTIKILYTMIKN